MARRCDVCGHKVRRRDTTAYWVGPGAETKEGHLECAKTAPHGTRAESATAMVAMLYKLRRMDQLNGGTNLKLVDFARQMYAQEMGVSDREAGEVVTTAMLGTRDEFDKFWKEHVTTRGADITLGVLRNFIEEGDETRRQERCWE